LASHGRRRGGAHAGGHNNSERWLLTYADLITLLMMLFVIMYAISTTDVKKAILLGESLTKAFSPGIFLGDAKTGLTQGGGNVSHPFITTTQRQDFGVLNEALTRLIREEGLEGGVSINTTREGTVISLSGSLLFPSGRAEIRPEAQRVLDRIAELIRPLPNKIRVEGHTDDLPPAVSLYPSNWELAAARALAVLRYLAGPGQIAPDRLSATSYGEFRPIAPNDGIAGRSQNRRADIVILYTPGIG
jgi:chemotaxis protein MotB